MSSVATVDELMKKNEHFWSSSEEENMAEINGPARHEDPFVDILHAHVTRAAESLTAGGLTIERSWLDPRDPRDATIILSDPASNLSARELALVWDEVTGWRSGVFEGGHQGVRTDLSSVNYLGGGLVLNGPELAARFRDGASEGRHEYRSIADVRDGLDDVLLQRG